jgi:ubiquinone/menaquinone biosynthesis C-methylase UbiE
MLASPEEPTSCHYGYDIPIRLMNLTGGGPETFEPMCEFHMAALKEHTPIEPHHSVLEIGCGIGRDAIPLSKILNSNGRYVGIDIVRDSIEWCTRNVSAAYPNFSFVHLDIEDQLHNPGGATTTTAIRLPVPDASIDRIILWSVFTHMRKADIAHYLAEFARVLKPSGTVFATWFIVNDEILKNARTVNLTPFNLRFEHTLADGSIINDPNSPMGAVAFSEEVLADLIKTSNLKLIGSVLPGQWSGYFPIPKGGQDATILMKAKWWSKFLKKVGYRRKVRWLGIS